MMGAGGWEPVTGAGSRLGNGWELEAARGTGWELEAAQGTHGSWEPLMGMDGSCGHPSYRMGAGSRPWDKIADGSWEPLMGARSPPGHTRSVMGPNGSWEATKDRWKLRAVRGAGWELGAAGGSL